MSYMSLDSVAAAAAAQSANREIARYAQGGNANTYWKFSIMLVKWSGHGSRSSSG